MSNNILNFVKENYDITEINNPLYNEIENLLNYDGQEPCYIQANKYYTYNINGLATLTPNLNTLTEFMPDLFRKCFYNKNGISVPTVCPKFVFKTKISYYYPLLINKDIIKSYLYFNFPSNIYNYSARDGIAYLAKQKLLINQKKLYETYGSTTNPNELFAILYNDNSLLVQLLKFNNYLSISDYKSNHNEIINNFTIIWDYTSYCISYTENINDSYIVGNTSNGLVFTQSSAQDTYFLKSKGGLSPFIDNTYNIDTIFTVLDIASEVYSNILLELQYFMSNSEYCQQNYMLAINIPYLLRFYEIYYKNEEYSISKNLGSNLSDNIVPTVITINQYVDDFISIYLQQYPRESIIKTVYLSKNDAFVFISNSDGITYTFSNYIYYYINILNPSPNKLIDYWKATINYAVSGVQTFIDNYINGIPLLWEGYLKFSNSSYYTFKTYNGGGLYPNSGYTPSNPLDVGYLYTFFNSNNSVNSTVYLTLITIQVSGNTYAYGCSLLNYTST
jgi:hypothetical protein